MISNKTETESVIPICVYCCCFYVASILLFILFGWSSYEIFIGYHYKEQIICNTDLGVTLSGWLIIKGTSFIITLITAILYINSGNNSLCKYTSLTFLTILNLFHLPWLIVGSILFWRDCPDVSPSIVNTTMWISLIYGYIYVLNNLLINNKKIEAEKAPFVSIA